MFRKYSLLFAANIRGFIHFDSEHQNVGGAGTFEEPVAPVYVDGKLKLTLRGDKIVAEFIDLLNEYVDRRYSQRVSETVNA